MIIKDPFPILEPGALVLFTVLKLVLNKKKKETKETKETIILHSIM